MKSLLLLLSCFSARDFSVLVPVFVTISQMFPPMLPLGESVKLLDRVTRMSINLQGLSYPQREKLVIGVLQDQVCSCAITDLKPVLCKIII